MKQEMLKEYIRLLKEEVDRMIQRSAGTFMPSAPSNPIMFRPEGPLGEEDTDDEQSEDEIEDIVPKYHQTVAAARRVKQIEKI